MTPVRVGKRIYSVIGILSLLYSAGAFIETAAFKQKIKIVGRLNILRIVEIKCSSCIQCIPYYEFSIDYFDSILSFQFKLELVLVIFSALLDCQQGYCRDAAGRPSVRLTVMVTRINDKICGTYPPYFQGILF